MVVPDLGICENMLMAEGFIDVQAPRAQVCDLYRLCKELLSKQPHYDWKLRAIKGVLRIAGG